MPTGKGIPDAYASVIAEVSIVLLANVIYWSPRVAQLWGTTPCTMPGTTRYEDNSTARRVLVVDDDVDSAEMLAELVGELGHEARTALDGPSAIRLAQQFLPHLVLLDISLQGMDGYEVARQLRSLPSLHGVILAAVTGWSGQRHEAMGREAGFDHYLVKPVQFAKLNLLLVG
jgi:CheY-like chemotaxis protein